MEDTMTPVSPIINVDPTETVPPQLMNFPEAMKAVIKGKKVRRVEWANTHYCFLNAEWLSINKEGTNYKWMVNDGDLIAEDWMIIDVN